MNLPELIARYPLPFELLETQKEDITALLATDKALLDLPVGYGKTVIATYTALGHESDRILVTLPPILIRQWVRWIDSIPNAGAALGYEGTQKERAEFEMTQYRWVFVSYQILNNDFSRLSDWLLSGRTPALIVDECQGLKNPGSVLFRNVKQLSDNTSTWLMTGTPMSTPGDAYSYIKIKTPEIYRDNSQFERIHVLERDFFKKPTEWHNLDLLNKNLRIKCVYRDKASVHKHLQSRTWPMYYKLSKEHMKLYEKLMEEQLLLFDDGSKIDATTAQKLYNAAQQIIANFDVYSGDPTARAATYDVLDSVCDQIAVQNPRSSKLIVWTWYKQTTASICQYLSGYGAVAAYSDSDSKASVERFLNDPTCRALVAQPGSAGAGLNPQYVCSEAIFIECPTRTIQFTQAAGRIDRQGQVNCANNRIAVAEGTVQEARFQQLMRNDDLVSQTAQTKTSIRKLIYGG